MSQSHHNKSAAQKDAYFVAQTESGFALPIVVILGLIMTVGGMAMMARMFGGLASSVKYEQTQQARAIAETGIAKTLAKLNNEYSYLLINCYVASGSMPTPNNCPSGAWDSNPYVSSSGCQGNNLGGYPDLTANLVNPPGEYTIDHYVFARGDQYYGGEGRLRVTGHRMNSDRNKTLASASIEVEFDVKTKPCNAKYDTPGNSSGFPGLMAESITMGNNDVTGTIANVLCTTCTKPTYLATDDDAAIKAANANAIDCKTQCVIDGSIFFGPVTLPNTEEFPSALSATSHDIDLKDGDVVLEAGEVDGEQTQTKGKTTTRTTLSSICAVDTDSVTHCRIGEIVGKGNGHTLTVTGTSSSEPVILYISGDIELAGNDVTIEHSGRAVDLTLSGIPRSADGGCASNQSIELAGGATGGKLFAHFPCGTVGINGGTGPTSSGDITGAVWAQSWDGSSANGASLHVPDDFAEDLIESKGDSYAISINEYIAIGINSWVSRYD